MTNISFFVAGTEPRAKQSFQYTRKGGYTKKYIVAWENEVAWRAKIAMRGADPLKGAISIRVVFHLGYRRRIDLDNLFKAVGDAMNGIVYEDDSQIVDLHVTKRISKDNGVWVDVYHGTSLPDEKLVS